MRDLMELVIERDRCATETQRPELQAEPWAKAFLMGALAMADWTLGKNGANPGAPRPSSLTRPLDEPLS